MKRFLLDTAWEKFILSDNVYRCVVYGGLAIIAGLLIFKGFATTYSDVDYHGPLKIQIRIEEKVDRIEEKVDKLIKLGEKYE